MLNHIHKIIEVVLVEKIKNPALPKPFALKRLENKNKQRKNTNLRRVNPISFMIIAQIQETYW